MLKRNVSYIFGCIFSELPKTRPEIRGGLPDNSYKPGDTLNLTCVSAPSNPPATLEWKLNGNSVSIFIISFLKYLRITG